MSDNHKITVSQPQMIQRETQTHPLVAIAIQQGGLDTQTMRELMTLQREYEADEARKAYTRSMVLLKAELPSILDRDTSVDFKNVHYRHTSLGAAVSAIVPHLTKFGFSHAWIPSTENGKVRVTCRLTHAEGHHDETIIEAPPDNSGSKSAPQAVASTITLLQRYTLLALLGIATADMSDPAPSSGDDTVNMKRNMQAVGRLESAGISKENACDYVGKTVDEWTNEDLEKLWQLMKEKKYSTPKIEGRRKELLELAIKIWGEDQAVPTLNSYLKNSGTSLGTIDDDGIDAAMTDLEPLVPSK